MSFVLHMNVENVDMLVVLTGVPEIGGLTSIQGLEIIRGCRGLNVIGGDLVEVLIDLTLFNVTFKTIYLILISYHMPLGTSEVTPRFNAYGL